MTRHLARFCTRIGATSLVLLTLAPVSGLAQDGVTRFVRYEHGGGISYGRLDGDAIQPLAGDLFSSPTPSGEEIQLSDVRLLAPVEPSKVIAVGLNYQSHLGNSAGPTEPALFAKLPTSIIGPGEAIVLPRDSENVHYETELVIVIGKKAKNVSVQEAADYIFGVTCGNDVSARDWQRSDLQWFRAKASDTFGPIGPVIARGLDYDNLMIQGRVNGKTVQKQRTDDLIFSTADIVSFTSRYVTLLPGDVIFTGTPGRTSALNPGDVVEIEVEGVGILSNPVVRESD